MASFRDLLMKYNSVGNNGNGRAPHPVAGSRLGTPPLAARDPDGLDPMRTSSAADWNGAAPRPHAAPGDELPFTDRPAGAGDRDPGGATTPADASRVGRWWRALTGAGDDSPGGGDAPFHDDGDTNGVHAITRNTDYWFEREIHVIERNAREQAGEWATKGLPRHDVVRTEPLEPEQVLAAHCTQLFREWQSRVRTKMQDAIEEGSQAVGRQVAALRNAITGLEAIRGENAELASRITRLRAEAERDAAQPVRYERYINGWLFWPGAVILATVEFFANFPVFRLMLPMSRILGGAAQSAADTVNEQSWLAGPQLLLREMLLHFEATVVALVAVIVLVLLGKTLGSSLRPLFAFSAADHPLAANTIRAHRRQKMLLVGASLAGIVLVLGFLYAARGNIADLAQQRVAEVDRQIVQMQRKDSLATDDATKAGIEGQILIAQQNRNLLDDDAAYARTVARINTPIALLNMALVLTALVLGFSYKSDGLSDKRGEHPEIVAARERMARLDQEMFVALGQGRQAESQAHAEIARVHHLLRANPLREWRSKLERLEGVIPLFRGENARLRGLDPANIRAFDLPGALDLPPVQQGETFQEPSEFARLKEEFDLMSADFAKLAPRMTPAFGHPTITT